MSDQPIETGYGAGRFARLSRVLGPLWWALAPFERGMARIGLTWPVLIAVGMHGLLFRQFKDFEGTWPNILFTSSVTLAITAALVLATRRLLLATFVTVGIVAMIEWASSSKRAIMNMVAHAYDLVFYLGSWSTVSFLIRDHTAYIAGFFGGVLAVGVVAFVMVHLDPTRVGRRASALAFAILVGLAAIFAEWKGERRHMQFAFEDHYVSSFYASFGETIETLWRGQLFEAAARQDLPPFAVPDSCRPIERPPHIILIHQESVVPPEIFPTLAYDRSVDPFFRSLDGVKRPMRVETYGGASWLTEFSILAGVSTHSFGGMRQFVQTFMQGKLKDTLPQTLTRCGYRNLIFYPMLKNFVSNLPFYRSIGLDEVFDQKDQGAKRGNERDRFYYKNTLDEIGRHIARSEKPLFAFVQTMSAHWPYNFVYESQENVPGGGPGTHPEMHEYLRRLSMTKMDYDYLKAELARRYPGERFLIVHYGDHHPMGTRLLLGFREEVEAEDVVLKPDSLGFRTYYAIDGVNYRPRRMPEPGMVDVPYLGTLILQSAGLPLSEAHRERLRLLARCEGRYHDCAQRDEILAFHRRLIDSGIMQAR